LDPLSNLARQIEELQRKFEQLKPLESEERKAKLEELRARAKRVEKTLVKLEKEQKPREEPLIQPQDVEMHHLDFLTDLARAWKGKALSMESLELLCRAQRISEYASLSENNALLLDPQRMKALRELLIS